MTRIKTTAIAGWFGSNRMLAERVGQLLGSLTWCGIPFCGGCCEIPGIQTSSGLASDRHRHLINLASTIASPAAFSKLVDAVQSRLFHEDTLRLAQERCQRVEARPFDGVPDVEAAADYFVVVWMSRGGLAGTPQEFKSGLSHRWKASGGDSAVRYRSAVESLAGWKARLERWTFVCLDYAEFLDRVHDGADYGLYADPPWPDLGGGYTHTFSTNDHHVLAERLTAFKRLRIVVRAGEHPLIRALYPESDWNWVMQTSRNQANNAVVEALIVRRR